jgi:hypothetical protein
MVRTFVLVWVIMLALDAPLLAGGWVIERHGNDLYGYGPNGQKWIEYRHGDVVYHRDLTPNLGNTTKPPRASNLRGD